VKSYPFRSFHELSCGELRACPELFRALSRSGRAGYQTRRQAHATNRPATAYRGPFTGQRQLLGHSVVAWRCCFNETTSTRRRRNTGGAILPMILKLNGQHGASVLKILRNAVAVLSRIWIKRRKLSDPKGKPRHTTARDKRRIVALSNFLQCPLAQKFEKLLVFCRSGENPAAGPVCAPGPPGQRDHLEGNAHNARRLGVEGGVIRKLPNGRFARPSGLQTEATSPTN
jgi:hypothetical protein